MTDLLTIVIVSFFGVLIGLGIGKLVPVEAS